MIARPVGSDDVVVAGRAAVVDVVVVVAVVVLVVDVVVAVVARAHATPASVNPNAKREKLLVMGAPIRIEDSWQSQF
jgi:hypothetical protein